MFPGIPAWPLSPGAPCNKEDRPDPEVCIVVRICKLAQLQTYIQSFIKLTVCELKKTDIGSLGLL